MANEALTDLEKEFRKRARRRLIGAVALVLLMVTVLPMLLDDQGNQNTPRPDVTISIPSRDDNSFSSKIVPMASPAKSDVAATAQPADSTEPLAPAPQEPISPAPAEPTALAAPPAPVKAEAAKQEPAKPEPAKPIAVKPEPPKAPPAKSKSESKPAEKPAAKPDPAEKSVSKPGSVFVQIGVFTSSAKTEQTQSKLSALGLGCGAEPLSEKNGSKLLRMRCGPFASKEAAKKAQEKLSAAGFANTIVVTRQ